MDIFASIICLPGNLVLIIRQRSVTSRGAACAAGCQSDGGVCVYWKQCRDVFARCNNNPRQHEQDLLNGRPREHRPVASRRVAMASRAIEVLISLNKLGPAPAISLSD